MSQEETMAEETCINTESLWTERAAVVTLFLLCALLTVANLATVTPYAPPSWLGTYGFWTTEFIWAASAIASFWLACFGKAENFIEIYTSTSSITFERVYAFVIGTISLLLFIANWNDDFPRLTSWMNFLLSVLFLAVATLGFPKHWRNAGKEIDTQRMTTTA